MNHQYAPANPPRLSQGQFELSVALLGANPKSTTCRAVKAILVEGLSLVSAQQLTNGNKSSIWNSTKSHIDLFVKITTATPKWEKNTPITSDHFNNLAELMKGKADSPAATAARLILVNGETAVNARKQTGSSTQNIFDATKRYRDLYEKITKLYG